MSSRRLTHLICAVRPACSLGATASARCRSSAAPSKSRQPMRPWPLRCRSLTFHFTGPPSAASSFFNKAWALRRCGARALSIRDRRREFLQTQDESIRTIYRRAAGGGQRGAPVALLDGAAELPQPQPRARAVEEQRDGQLQLRPAVLALLLFSCRGVQRGARLGRLQAAR